MLGARLPVAHGLSHIQQGSSQTCAQPPSAVNWRHCQELYYLALSCPLVVVPQPAPTACALEVRIWVHGQCACMCVQRPCYKSPQSHCLASQECEGAGGLKQVWAQASSIRSTRVQRRPWKPVKKETQGDLSPRSKSQPAVCQNSR